ncbi:MAG: hypothetical protein H0X66_21785 [Verrucomicrobia bacterium]|nr:hypothetical protein [Verrucomicrobiota bacterium]
MRIVSGVQGKLLPFIFVLIFALSRWPGLMPDNFSAAYAFAFCAGVFLPRKISWWLPLGTLLVTDLALNCYYQFTKDIDCFTLPTLLYMLGNYAGYVVLIALGRGFKPKSSFVGLLGGGVLGALLFYLVTNTLSWLLNPFGNPEYLAKTLGTWILALTKGTGGWPDTWTFLRNTLLSGGLFTGLFALGMKLSESAKEAEEPEESNEAEIEPTAEPEESKA